MVAAAALLPVAWHMRAEALLTQRFNHLRAVYIACRECHTEHSAHPRESSVGADGRRLLSWRVHLLPYLEQAALDHEFKLDEPWDSPHNAKLVERMPREYGLPGGNAKPVWTYLRGFSVRNPASQVHAAFRNDDYPGGAGFSLTKYSDAPTETILVLDVAEPTPWTKPDELELPSADRLPRFGLPTEDGGFLVLFADGHVETVSRDVPPEKIRAMLTIDGGD